MTNGRFARRNVVLALAAFAVVSLCGTGTAVAADRMEIAENFTGTW